MYIVCSNCGEDLNTPWEDLRNGVVESVIKKHSDKLSKVSVNKKTFLPITDRLEITDGHCPCIPIEDYSEDTVCPCKKFREELKCCCNLYTVHYKDEDTKN